MTTPTREPKTEQAYLKRAAELGLAAARYFEMEDAGPVAPITMVNYLISQLPTYRPASVRYNKAAMRCFFEKCIAEGDESGMYTEALAKLEEIHPVTRRKDLAPKTSAGKRKSIPLGDLIKLTESMLATPAFWPPRALRFLQANIAAGLRPGEWPKAEWISDTQIHVTNAKHTNGRAHGVSRIVDVEPDHWLSETVPLHTNLLREWLAIEGNTFEDYYTNCRKALQRACRKLWPKRESHITLYTGRHQFCANLKAEDESPAAVAYAMGHGSEDTATTHYGKKRYGWKGQYRPTRNPAAPHLPAPDRKAKNSPV